MKNARKMADQVMIDIEKTRHRSDWAIIPIRDIIAKALQAAYQKGAEDMRIAAAKVAEKRIVHNARLDYDAGWNRGANLIEDEIRHLPLHPEGGGR